MAAFAGRMIPDEVLRGMLASMPPAARAAMEAQIVWQGAETPASRDNATQVARPTSGIDRGLMGADALGTLSEERRRAVEAGQGTWEDLFLGNANASANQPLIRLDPTQQNESRQLQQNTIQNLHKLAMGDPNSQAQQQLGESFSQSRGGVGTLAAARRDVGTGAAMRGSAFQQAGLQQQQANAAKLLQMQERQAAQQALADALGMQRGQDTEFAQGDANVQVGSQGANDQITGAYTGMLGQAGANQIGAGVNRARSKLGFDQGWGELFKEGGQKIAEGVGTAISTIGSIFEDD